MKTKLLAGLLLVGSAAFAGGSRVSIGVNIGGGPGYGYAPAPAYSYLPPPPPMPRGAYNRPPMPGRGYVWVDGFWSPNGRQYRWTQGYWMRPPQGRGRWVAPRYQGNRYYNGYWR